MRVIHLLIINYFYSECLVMTYLYYNSIFSKFTIHFKKITFFLLIMIILSVLPNLQILMFMFTFLFNFKDYWNFF